MYKSMFEFVENYLSQNDNVFFPFRKRSEHISRVFMWAERLIPKETPINRDALLIAAIFHDVGYTSYLNAPGHAENSAIICEKYLNSINFDKDATNFIVYLVRNHSKKDLMTSKDIPLELLLLMEADLLDETGALSIVWDCMTEGSQEVQSFEKTYNHIIKFSGQLLKSDPMVTELGKKFWKDKQNLIELFTKQLSFDLGLNDSIL